MQAVGAVVFTLILDSERIGNRRTRGMVAIVTMGTIISAGWIGLCLWLVQHPLDFTNLPNWDWTDSEYAGLCVINLVLGMNMVIVSIRLNPRIPFHPPFFFGPDPRQAVTDCPNLASQYQLVCQWVIAALTNDPQALARYAGLAKGGLAGGLASAFGTEAAGLAQTSVLAYCFSLQFAGLFCMMLVCWKCVSPTNYLSEDTVIVPLSFEKAHPHGESSELEIEAISVNSQKAANSAVARPMSNT